MGWEELARMHAMPATDLLQSLERHLPDAAALDREIGYSTIVAWVSIPSSGETARRTGCMRLHRKRKPISFSSSSKTATTKGKPNKDVIFWEISGRQIVSDGWDPDATGGDPSDRWVGDGGRQGGIAAPRMSQEVVAHVYDVANAGSDAAVLHINRFFKDAIGLGGIFHTAIQVGVLPNVGKTGGSIKAIGFHFPRRGERENGFFYIFLIQIPNQYDRVGVVMFFAFYVFLVGLYGLLGD
jgi:hypothetical protein